MSFPNTLQVSTPSDREIVMTRRFEAPRELVWEAWTTPELLERWLFGPDGWSLAVCEQDLRPGGALRWVWRMEGGIEMGLSGVYREIVAPERIVHTELFDQDWTGGETLVTTRFEERGGVTTVVMTVLYSSKQARDGALSTPMAEGMETGYVRLERVLAELRSASR